MCYTEKASPTRHRPVRQHNARSNRRKQCSPNETKPYSKPTLPRKRQTTHQQCVVSTRGCCACGSVLSLPPRCSLRSLLSLVCFHIRDEIRHGSSDSCESLPMAVPQSDPQHRLHHSLSRACSTDSGQNQSRPMLIVHSWRPNI